MKKLKGFCMTCSMRSIVKQSFSTPRKRAYTPSIVVKNLKRTFLSSSLSSINQLHELIRERLANVQRLRNI